MCKSKTQLFAAILEMNVHVPFTENIRPICLPYTGINTQYYNQIGTIAGWGKTTDQHYNIVTYGTNTLREVDTLIFNTDLCGKLIHFMGNYAWRQSPSGNSISRYVISTLKTYLSVSMRKIFFRNDLCTHTRSSATTQIHADYDSGQCDAKCWKDFFQIHDFEAKARIRETPCYGDNGTTLMVKENERKESKKTL